MSRRSFQRKLRVEQLEAKTLLAGDVTVTLIGGSLIITGDDLDNGIELFTSPLHPNDVTIGAIGGTTVNGALGSEFQFSGVTKDIKVDLRGGDDLLRVSNIDLPRNLIVKGGTGNDRVSLGFVENESVFAPVTVAGSVQFDAGDGDDLVLFKDLTVAKDFLFDGGNGNDEFFRVPDAAPLVLTSEVNGSMLINTGKGNDLVGIESLSIGDRLIIDAGADDDQVGVIDVVVGRFTAISLGSGTDVVALAAVDAGLSLTIVGSGANSIDLAQVSASHLVKIFTGSGNDMVMMQGVTTTLALVHTDGGADELAILDSVFALLEVNLGSGNDTITLDGVTVEGLALIFGGSGLDTLILGDNNINFGWAFSFEDCEYV